MLCHVGQREVHLTHQQVLAVVDAGRFGAEHGASFCQNSCLVQGTHARSATFSVAS
jgi:hypothetical protein